MMNVRTLHAAALVALALAASLPGRAEAQSGLASRGLGYPVDAVDARGRALGGGIGFADPRLSLTNPAALAGMPAPIFGFTYQGDSFQAAAPGAQAGSTARFPLIQAAFPFRQRAVFSLGYGSFLDQHWQAEREDSLVFAGERRHVADRFASAGGAARLRLGGAYQFGRQFGAGVAVDVFTGSVRDSVVREIEGLLPSREGTEHRYEGLGFSAGVRWTPHEALAVEGALSGGGELRATARGGWVDRVEDPAGLDRAYSIPLRAHAGASARVTQATLVVLSGRWSGWSSADGALVHTGGARDVIGAGAAMEYDGFALAGRRVPLRVGARYDQLPFAWQDLGGGAGFANETALTGGLGVRLAGGAAQLDLGAERGWRGGAPGFDEPYWRVSLSAALLGR
jgi:hypothetical protein